MKKTILIITGFLLGVTLQNHAQSKTVTGTQDNLEQTKTTKPQKRFLTPEDYKLWNTLSGQKISSNGEWCAYFLRNEYSKISTLFVVSTKTNTKYELPIGAIGQFSPNGKRFVYITPKKGLGVLDLEKGTTEWFPKVSNFEFLVRNNGNYLIAHNKHKSATEQSGLLIIDLTKMKQQRISGVTAYQINPVSNTIAYIVDGEENQSVKLRTIEASPKTTIVIEEGLSNTYKSLLWSKDGCALTFLEEVSEGLEKQKRIKLYYYNTKKKPYLQCLDSIADKTPFRRGKISGDGTAVFFDVISLKSLDIRSKNGIPDNVQVWNTKDKRIYPEKKRNQQLGKAEFGAFKAVWWPLKGKTMVIETTELPEAIIANNGKYMLSYNPTAYAPHFKEAGDIDIYLTNLETGEQSLFLKQQTYGKFGFHHNVQFSPEGKYIHYFRDKHWWIYDLEKKTYANVTKELEVQLYETEDEGGHPGGVEPYLGKHRSLYWTTGDKELVIYDRYDIWLITPKGKAKRITRGKENKIRYRLARWFYLSVFGQERELNTLRGLVLESLDTKTMASGYAIWKPKKGLETLFYKNMRVNGLKKANEREAYIYLEQSFDTAPRIMYWEQGMSDSKILMESNPQQKQFQWGQAELVHYTSPKGEALKGALFYPANYEVGKKYPMIVNIYEQNSNYLHIYENPTEYSMNGFNRSNYTADGYIVFLPDIKYKFNDPGVSAVRCIEAGVKAVLKKGIVEANHIGLVGHSFGGYETAFIITQTNMFTTAVAGAAVTDVVSFYHSIEWGGTYKNRSFWFENNQHRYTHSFYQNMEAYLRNSPLYHADNINTPLLLWTGGKDVTIDWHQSIEMYLGLRRLDKECTLLLYSDESHSIRKPENQVHITSYMKAWFDKYLKP